MPRWQSARMQDVTGGCLPTVSSYTALRAILHREVNTPYSLQVDIDRELAHRVAMEVELVVLEHIEYLYATVRSGQKRLAKSTQNRYKPCGSHRTSSVPWQGCRSAIVHQPLP